MDVFGVGIFDRLAIRPFAHAAFGLVTVKACSANILFLVTAARRSGLQVIGGNRLVSERFETERALAVMFP